MKRVINILKKLAVFSCALAVAASFISCEEKTAGTGYAEWAGVRCSPYGWGKNNYPSASKLKKYVKKMQSFYNKDEDTASRGVVVLIVGSVSGNSKYSCQLGFPNEYPEGHEKAGQKIESFSSGVYNATFENSDR
ncbi:MAG: hypothetical protein J5780_07000, partial [Treponema sp.]|nr:hypothetical protein [Treponema sp.]